MTNLDELADRVVREAQELTESRIAAAPGEHPFIQCHPEQPRAPLESEAAFLDAARSLAVAWMNSIPEDVRIATGYKIDNHGAKLWVSVNAQEVVLLLELRGECVEIARRVVEIDPMKLN